MAASVAPPDHEASNHTTTTHDAANHTIANGYGAPKKTPEILADYRFPSNRIQRQQLTGKKPLVLVACGSFSPLSFLHLRLFEQAKDFARLHTEYEVVGGFFSPVSDAYGKKSLAPAEHRIAMCTMVAEQISGWLTCDPWEAIQDTYTPTAQVLDHFHHEVNKVLGGVEDTTGTRVPARMALLAGADVLQSMSVPNLWSPKDLHHILGDYGAFILERHGTDMDEAIKGVKEHRENIYVIPQPIPNDVSSTGIRTMLRENQSLRYLTPDAVIEYIESHNLYKDP